MKNSKKMLLGVIITYSIFFIDLNAQDRTISTSNIYVLDSKKLDGNNISAWFRNNGSFDRDPVTGSSGFEWPYGSSKFLTYAAGLWLAGKVKVDTLVAISSYFYEYFPGYIDVSGNPQGKDDPAFRIYKILKGDTTSIDYLNWPVSQGAYLDSINKPFLPGTQTMFYSMTDGYPESHVNNYGNTAPLKAQVQVTNWCYNIVADQILSNVIFMEFKVINKNTETWNDGIISFWADECSDEQVAIGCDTILNLGYAYCHPNSFNFGNAAPAFGFLLLQGPVKYTGNPNDTVYSFVPGKNNRRIRIGYKEIGLNSFNMFQNGNFPYGSPRNLSETYYTMRGKKRAGEDWIIPGTTTVTKFPFSGDPESGIGWNQFNIMGYGNRRLLVNLGFINFNPGDTQSIIIAQVVSQGSNNLNSVTKLKNNCEYIKNIFKQNFTTVGIFNTTGINKPQDFNLYQNFPNPFNPVTKIKFSLTQDVRRETQDVSLIVYDVKGREIEKLYKGKLSPGTYEVEWNAAQYSSGVYFYKLDSENFSGVKRMILLK